jgi:hypothetical protein
MDEIGIAFDLLAHLSLRGLKAHMFPFVPLKVLSGCLDLLGGPIAWLLQLLETPSHQDLAPVPTSSGLLTIIKRLDHSWIDHMAVSAKATKNNAAIVATHMWNQWILLPLPHVVAGLPCLCLQMMWFQRIHLYPELRVHMVANQGAD